MPWSKRNFKAGFDDDSWGRPKRKERWTTRNGRHLIKKPGHHPGRKRRKTFGDCSDLRCTLAPFPLCADKNVCLFFWIIGYQPDLNQAHHDLPKLAIDVQFLSVQPTNEPTNQPTNDSIFLRKVFLRSSGSKHTRACAFLRLPIQDFPGASVVFPSAESKAAKVDRVSCLVFFCFGGGGWNIWVSMSWWLVFLVFEVFLV